MNKVLKEVNVLFHNVSSGHTVLGLHDGLSDAHVTPIHLRGVYGNCSLISGNTSCLENCDVSYISGDISHIRGSLHPDLTGEVTFINGRIGKIYGDASRISGDVTHISGDVSGLVGNVSQLIGNVTGVLGDATGIAGDLNEAGLSDAERDAGVRINDLVGLAITEESMVGQQPVPDPVGIEPTDVGIQSRLVRLEDIDFDNPEQMKSLENTTVTVPVKLMYNLLISYYNGGGEANSLQEILPRHL